MSIYRITVKAAHAFGGAQYNTHHYEFPGYVPTEEEAEEACQNLADAYEEALLTVFSEQVAFSEIEYRRVDVGNLPTAVYIPTGWPVTGGSVQASLPHQVAAVCRWVGITEFPRSSRIFLPSFTAGSLGGGGFISTGAVIAVDTLAIALEQLEVTAQPDAQRVAVHYSGDPSAVVASNLVSARPTQNVWGIQRRRRPNVGI